MNQTINKCHLCNDTHIVKIECIICDGDKKNIDCTKCVNSVGYIFSKKCIDKCFTYNCKPAMEYYSMNQRVPLCTICLEKGVPCGYCDETGIACYMCYGVGIITQICPACIISGKIQTIKD